MKGWIVKLLTICNEVYCIGGWLYGGWKARIQGGGGGARVPWPPPFSESGFRKNPGIHFYSGFREKKHKGVQFEILRNPGIDFYGGFRKKIQV